MSAHLCQRNLLGSKTETIPEPCIAGFGPSIGMEALKEKLLRSDFERVNKNPRFQTSNVQTKNGSIFVWTLAVPGGRGTSWEGLVYDLEITFSRRHPFEPPRVDFPRTHRNVSNPRHPLVDGSGRLRMQKLSFDKWLPTIEASTVIGWLYHLFETEPPSVTSGNKCPFTHLSCETVLQVHTFLDAGDLGRLSQTGKHMLSLCFAEATWAKLYYRSCTSLDGLLGEKEGGACPVRVMGVSGKWFWEGSREAFIRSWEMRKACYGRAFSTAKTQKAHIMWELGGLMTVAAGLLSDVTSRPMNLGGVAGNSAQLRHMEYLLDSQAMRIASLQRLLAWPAVCRSLLGEKEDDSSLPIGLWDQAGVFSDGSKGGRRRPLDGPTSAWSGVGESLVAATELGELNGREARLTKEQRDAMCLLCANLAAFPLRPRLRSRRSRWYPVEGGTWSTPASGLTAGTGGGPRARIRGQEGGAGWPAEDVSETAAECSPHHHHVVTGPAIPYGMDRVELPARDSWLTRNPAPGPGGAAVAAAAADAAPAAGGNPPANLAGAHYPHWLAENISGHHHYRGGDATLVNPQPACGLGGLCWPTLYDLTMVKRRQRERLRDCFRRFFRGQKLDVRDPSGEWMGAVVLWAPPVCTRSIPVPAPTLVTLATHGHGQAHGGANAGGVAGAAAGGVDPPHGGIDLTGSDTITPEWRRLLQLALLADGGHMNVNQGGAAAAAAAAAAAVAGGAGNGNGVAPVPQAPVAAAAGGGVVGATDADENAAGFDGGDWVTTGIPDGAQSFLASAVAAAADSRPWPPPTPPQPSGNSTHRGAMLAGVEAAPISSNGGSLTTMGGMGASAGSMIGGRPPGGGGNTVLIHYEGHKSRYDEWIAVGSPRLAPYRSRSARPLSVTMQSVQRLVKGMSVRSDRGVPAPDCVEVSLSCPWISHCAGGGVVTYRLPRSTTLGAVLADFCHLAGISLWRATIHRANVHITADMRMGRSDVKELDDRRTLEYLRIPSGSVLIVCVVPATGDILPSCSPAVPPRPGDGASSSTSGGSDGSSICRGDDSGMQDSSSDVGPSNMSRDAADDVNHDAMDQDNQEDSNGAGLRVSSTSALAAVATGNGHATTIHGPHAEAMAVCQATAADLAIPSHQDASNSFAVAATAAASVDSS